MRYALASLALLAASAPCFSQLPPVVPEMRWMVNDERRIEVTTTTRVQPNDSVKLSMSGRTLLNAKVTDLKKDVFILQVNTAQTDMLNSDKACFGLPDSITAGMRKAPANAYDPLFGKNVPYSVDRKGKLLGIYDPAAHKARVHDDLMEGALDMLAQDQQQNKRSASELDAAVNGIIDSLDKAFTGAQMRTVNDLLAVFNHPLPGEGSERKPLAWKGLFIPGLGTLPEMPATRESGCDKVDAKELVVRVVTTCDGDALLKYMNQRTAPTTGTDPRTVKPPLKKQDVSLVEESVYTFDRTTGWLTLVTTELRFRAGTLSARSNTRSTVSVTRP